MQKQVDSIGLNLTPALSEPRPAESVQVNITAVTANGPQTKCQSNKKKTLQSSHSHSRIKEYEMGGTHNTHSAMRNVYIIFVGTPHTNNSFLGVPQVWWI
jgi:hypothetical protein